MIKIVSVFGTSSAKAGDKSFALAEEVGRSLAIAGFAIANGGYGGTMLAAAKGAREAGGEVIGVTCAAFGRGPANEHVSREIVTRSLSERLEMLVQLGSGYVVLPGGTGTLLELAMVWELKNKGFIGEDKPIILVGEYWSEVVDVVAADDASSRRHFLKAKEPKDVVKILKERIQRR